MRHTVSSSTFVVISLFLQAVRAYVRYVFPLDFFLYRQCLRVGCLHLSHPMVEVARSESDSFKVVQLDHIAEHFM